MLNQLYKLDMYGVGLNLRYNREELYQTRFGGFVTLLIFVFILVQFILSGLDMINKKNPEIIQTERQVSSPERFVVKDNTFNFAVGVQHQNVSHYIDESVYTISMNITNMHKVYDEEIKEYKQVWSYKNIPMKPCELDQFQVQGTKNYFNTLAQVKQMYCIADPNHEEIFIEGNYDSDQYAYIRIEFRKCKGQPHCKKESEIDAQLEHAFIAMYSSDIVVDAKERNPFQESGKDTFWRISSEVAKDIELYFRNIYMQSDEGILFKDNKYLRTTRQSFSTESVNQQFFLKLDRLYDQIGFLDLSKFPHYNIYYSYKIIIAFENFNSQFFFVVQFQIIRQLQLFFYSNKFIFKEDNYFLSLLLRFEKQKETLYYRKYKKIDQLLAEIGGIAKALIILGFIICFPFNKLNLHENLANHLFIFKRTDIKDEKQKEEEKRELQTNGVALNFLRNLTPKMNQLTRNLSFRVQQQIQQQQIQRDSQENNSKEKEESNQINKKDITSHASIEQSENKIPQKSKFNQIINKIQQKNQGSFKQVLKNISSFQQISDSAQKTEDLISNLNENKAKQNEEQLKNKNNFFNDNTIDHKLELSWKQYVKYYFWPWGSVKNIKKQVDTSINSIYSYVDIIKIIQMQLEFEKVKNLLLNEDQIKLLKFLPKPVIDVSEQENKNTSIFQNKKSNKRFQRIDLLNQQQNENIGNEAAQAFENIINQKALSDTDVKLIMMLDDKVLNQMMNNRINQQTQNYQNQQQQFFNFFELSKKNSQQDQLLQPSSQQSLKNQKLENEKDIDLIKFEEIEYELEDSISIDIKNIQKISEKELYQVNSLPNNYSKQNISTLTTGVCLEKQTTNKISLPSIKTFNIIGDMNKDQKIHRKVNVPANSFADMNQIKLIQEHNSIKNHEYKLNNEQNTYQYNSSLNNFNFEKIITDST